MIIYLIRIFIGGIYHPPVWGNVTYQISFLNPSLNKFMVNFEL